jgi:uncharacterized protein (DUF2141 family)
MKIKTVFFFVLLSIIPFLTVSFIQETKQVIRITNLKKVKGNLYLGWYKDAATFRINEKAIYRKKIIINNQDEISVVFNDIPKGRYAIAVFLDENDNYKLDKNLFGIPKEKYGFSNNVLPSVRAATFDESSFVLKQQETEITITLK